MLHVLFLTTKTINIFLFFHVGAPQHGKLAGAPGHSPDAKS